MLGFAEAFAAIKPIIAKSVVTLDSGELVASDGVITIVVPVDCDAKFSVRGPDLARAAGVHGNDVSLRTTDVSLIMKSGTLRSVLPLSPDTAIRADIAGTSVETPDDFAEKLQKAAKFMSTDQKRPWARSVRVHNGHLYATNNVSIIEVDCDVSGDVTLPDNLVRYMLTRRGNLSSMVVGDNSVKVCWVDGGHVVAALSEAMPDRVVEFVTGLKRYGSSAIADEWRAAFNAAASLGHDELTISSSKMIVNTCSHVFEADIETSTTHETRWTVAFLRNVINVATHFDPAVSPAQFHGDGLRGLIMGRK